MVTLYLIALIPLVTGGILFLKSRNFSWQEWLIVSLVGFGIAGLFHLAVNSSMTSDTETWSGEITSAVFYPKWIEEYQERHSKTYYTGSGENRKSHTKVWYTTEHRTHSEHWTAFTSLDVSHSISEEEFNHIRSKFKDLTVSTPFKPGFDGGDRNIYTSYNKTGYVFPVTTKRTFENRVKASPSLFRFPEVPENIPVFCYPNNGDWRRSDRLVGIACKKFSIREFDVLNAELGPKKKVNVIIVGYPKGTTNQDAEWLKSKWMGGKKNDLVICYGGDNNGKAEWASVFGWTEEELVKKNLETLFINNVVGDNLLPEIRTEIIKNYTIKDWSKFDYLSVEPPVWVYYLYLVIIILMEGALIFFFLQNDEWNRSSYPFQHRRRW